jgi:hypothetical protein
VRQNKKDPAGIGGSFLLMVDQLSQSWNQLAQFLKTVAGIMRPGLAFEKGLA